MYRFLLTEISLYLGNSMNLNSIELCLNIDKDDHNKNTRNHKIATADGWHLLQQKFGSRATHSTETAQTHENGSTDT
jgi:hypothetical protein